MKAPAVVFEAERVAILERANSSQLEPYDYKLSLRHQAFNAALRERPDLNKSMGEIGWIQEISQAQYRSQLSRDPSFDPEVRRGPDPDWSKKQRSGPIAPDRANSNSKEAESPSRVQIAPTAPQTSAANPVLRARMRSNAANLDALADKHKTAELTTRSILGSLAKTFPAQTCSGVYKGPIIAETQDMVLQRISALTVVAHPKELFGGGQLPKIGTNVSVTYSNAAPLFRQLQNREEGVGLER